MTFENQELVSAVLSIVDRIGVDTQTPAGAVDAEIWAALTESGFSTVSVSEEYGGGAGTLADALAVISAVTRTGAVTPLIEHTIATWLASAAGHEVQSTSATVGFAGDGAILRRRGDAVVLEGTVSDIVHAESTDTIVLLVGTADGDRPRVVVVSTTAEGVTQDHGTDLVGAALTDVTFVSTPVVFCGDSPIDTEAARDLAAVAYSVAMSAAATSVRDRTVQYAGERQQFGRPLAKFQAIQQSLAWLAALTAMTETAVAAAVEATMNRPDQARAAVATAKVVTSENARAISNAAHQIHGAIGFTSEYPLGRFTTSLLSWRDRYGNEHEWATVLADQILDDGADLWDTIVGDSSATRENTTEVDPA